MNRYDLERRTVVITGGAGGIGRAIAKTVLANGAHVSLWDRDEAGLSNALRELNAGVGHRTVLRIVDVTSEHGVTTALKQDVAEFGRIDAFINNAGILGEVAPLWETDTATFRQVIEVNLIGAYLCLRAALDQMRKQRPDPMRGHIVNVASIQGKEGMPRAGAYSASKAGLVALTKTAGKEAAELRIAVNCITPAAAETSMAQALTRERRAEIRTSIPMGRFVEVDEIARMVAFLCSDDCSFSTGAVFDLSGGRATY